MNKTKYIFKIKGVDKIGLEGWQEEKKKTPEIILQELGDVLHILPIGLEIIASDLSGNLIPSFSLKRFVIKDRETKEYYLVVGDLIKVTIEEKREII